MRGSRLSVIPVTGQRQGQSATGAGRSTQRQLSARSRHCQSEPLSRHKWADSRRTSKHHTPRRSPHSLPTDSGTPTAVNHDERWMHADCLSGHQTTSSLLLRQQKRRAPSAGFKPANRRERDRRPPKPCAVWGWRSDRKDAYSRAPGQISSHTPPKMNGKLRSTSGLRRPISARAQSVSSLLFDVLDDHFSLVPPAGFEPATHGLGNRCSIP